ncbi:MAG: hypothetical protein H6838_05700 [Planctomycetes bacterium]|nr:hypothetical protein [Planctomycetota bacterium]
MSTRRYGTILRHLREVPEAAAEFVARLSDELLVELGATIADEVQRRARKDGDQDAVIAAAFEVGFARDGLGVLPWIEAPFVVCPGGLVAKNRANHRCQFVSVDDTWVWEHGDLIREDKRSMPGAEEGFRAIALLPITEGMALDVVRARMRQGQHSVERVTSLVVRKGRLVEVERRDVSARGAR